MPNIKTVEIEARQTRGFTISAAARMHNIAIDQPAPLGGDNGPTPLEYLLSSLAGCLIGTAFIIARQRQLAIRGMEVKVEGSLDTDVVGGRCTDCRAGFAQFNVTFVIDADMSPAEKEAFVAEVSHRCPVSDNLRNPTPMIFSVV